MYDIPRTTDTLIPSDKIPSEKDYKGLKILRYQTDQTIRENVIQNRYIFQHQPADYTVVKATLCRKGFVTDPEHFRLTAIVNVPLKLFTEIVKYDPSNPPHENYEALDMKDAHNQTQSDFKGQKATNKDLFKNYILEGITGNRTVYLPMVSGWQSQKVFDKTVFIAYDEENPDAMYGQLYIPKSPVMQADGQTQTAALFAVANSADAIASGALENLSVTLEIELDVDRRAAGQSFADRNGRGSKKNKNLVIALDTSSALSDLRIAATEGTVFEGRIADGRTTGTTETATKNIVDLNTMEQMLLNAISNGRYKPEQFKHFHIDEFKPYARAFIVLLEELFGKDWLENTPKNHDTFRRLYVHGWPFALKAIALAYYESRIDELGPRSAAIAAKDPSKPLEQAFRDQLAIELQNWEKKPEVSFDELKRRLKQIDWLRYREHWINLAGAKIGKDGKPKTFKLKSTGEEKVMGQAQNTATVISSVKAKILSNRWEDLTKKVDAKVKGK